VLSLGALSFVVPAALFAFLVLPVLWWLLRLIPPAPQRIRFPAIRLIMRLVNPEESSAKTPLWLVILRTALIALVILAAAHPVFNAGAEIDGEGPVVLVVDDGWGSARNWTGRQTVMTDLIDRAGRAGRAVALVTTAPASTGAARDAKSLLSADDAKGLALALEPKPWPTDRLAATAIVDDLALNVPAHVIWLSDGLDGPGARELADRLKALGELTVFSDPVAELARLLPPPEADRQGLTVRALRAAPGDQAPVVIRGRDDEGRVIVRQPMTIGAGDLRGETRIELPLELRNRLTRIEIENENTAGAVVLLDERWRRRPVGIVTGAARRADQPLLDEVFYLDRALDPFTEVRTGAVAELLSRELAMMAMPDAGALEGPDAGAIAPWVEAGGILVRFAGPLLAASPDPLLPVQLRTGDRELGGALSWSEPAGLAIFDDRSPFHGLPVPDDVKVRRQVLAQPSLDLVDKTWARLKDGTPLVTAERRGKGWIVLMHTTANPTWSDLPLSGLFVSMLEKLVEMGRGVAGPRDQQLLAPLRSLGGFGDLIQPLPGALAIPGAQFETTKPGPRHPPGYYGEPSAQVALNLSAALSAPAPLGSLGADVRREDYGGSRETDTRPWLLTAALILALADLIASLALRGLLTGARVATGAVLLILAAPPALAQSGGALSEKMMDAALHLRLGFIETGNREIDGISRAGLLGLSSIANARTAAELAHPMAVDLETDELAFFPLLYWPITSSGPDLDESRTRRLNQYLKRGGTILFDTREQGGTEFAGARLREIGRALDLPPLVPIANDHVLSRSYYLLREFPGRYAGGGLWVERDGARVNDGVSSVIVGGNDWAAAWAVGPDERPLYPVVPGGERQREIAYRFGINVVMYVLTGNYKEDQVHLPAILERLGQ
jgi:hypothetical protein